MGEIKVGMTVYLKPTGANNTRRLQGSILDHVIEAKVSKVGRKYFYVEGRDEKVREVAAKHKADGINNRVEHFVLRFIKDTETYVKEFLTGEAAGTLDFKCMTSLMMPFIFRAVYGNPANENDNVFDYEGRLAKWLEGTTINLDHEFSAVKSWERL